MRRISTRFRLPVTLSISATAMTARVPVLPGSIAAYLRAYSCKLWMFHSKTRKMRSITDYAAGGARLPFQYTTLGLYTVQQLQSIRMNTHLRVPPIPKVQQRTKNIIIWRSHGEFLVKMAEKNRKLLDTIEMQAITILTLRPGENWLSKSEPFHETFQSRPDMPEKSSHGLRPKPTLVFAHRGPVQNQRQ